ncbi:HAD-IC family P-type ATPase, partial [Escherichia coli]
IAIMDAIRPEAAAAIQQLHQLGIKTAMITGDHILTAHHVANALSIDVVYAQTQPGDKAQIIKQLQANYGTVAFVGDG